MRRIVIVLAAGLMSAALATGVAEAAPAKPPVGTAPRTAVAQDGPRHWYAVAGVRRSELSAKELVAELKAKHFEGFEIHRREMRQGVDRVRREEVERLLPDRRAAESEAKRLREAGFPGRTAHERG